MSAIRTLGRATLVAGLFGLAACAAAPASAPAGGGAPAATACRAPLKPAIGIELYFGRALPGGGEIAEAHWRKFLAEEVTPRFPAGLSGFDVAGQHRDPRTGEIVLERTKMVLIVVPDTPESGAKRAADIAAVIDAYKARFAQIAVFHVEKPVCASL